MAQLKGGTTIAGFTAWHYGNLRINANGQEVTHLTPVNFDQDVTIDGRLILSSGSDILLPNAGAIRALDSTGNERLVATVTAGDLTSFGNVALSTVIQSSTVPYWNDGTTSLDLIHEGNGGTQVITGNLTTTGHLHTKGSQNFIATAADAAANSHLYFRNSSGLNEGILYWRNSTDTMVLRRYDTDGSSTAGQIEVHADKVTFNDNELIHAAGGQAFIGDVNFDEDIILANNKTLWAKTSGGTPRIAVRMRATDYLSVGDIAIDTEIGSSSVPQWWDGSDRFDLIHSGGNQTITGSLKISGSTAAYFVLNEQDSAVDEKQWDFKATSGNLVIQAIADGGGGGGATVKWTRSGNNITSYVMSKSGIDNIILDNWNKSIWVDGTLESTGNATIGGTLSVTANISTSNHLHVNGGSLYVAAPAASNANYWLRDDALKNRGVMFWNRSDGSVRIRNLDASEVLQSELIMSASDIRFQGNSLLSTAGGQTTPDLTVTNFIKFGPATALNDDGHIEWLGGDNAGYLRFSVGDDTSEHMEFGDYQGQNRGGSFVRWAKMERGKVTVDGEVETSGDVTSGSGKVNLTASASVEFDSTTNSIDFVFA